MRYFNPVESIGLHIYETYLLFTATHLILQEERDMNREDRPFRPHCE
jgi:hypothetical protein